MSPLAELIRVRTAWGVTNLEKCQEAADKLLAEFPPGLVEEWATANIKPGEKPWELYGAFRKWNLERRAKERAEAAQRESEEVLKRSQEQARKERESLPPEEQTRLRGIGLKAMGAKEPAAAGVGG